MPVSPSAYAQEKSRPTLKICYPHYSYPETLASLRRLDLKDSEVVTFDEGGRPGPKAHLRAGKCEVRFKETSYWLGLKWSMVLQNEPSETEIAVAQFDLVETAGSSSDYGVVQVFQLKEGRLSVVQQILFNTRGSAKVGATLDARSNTLTIRGVHGWEHCCPTELDVVRFRIDGDLFKLMGHRKVPLE